MDPQCVESVAPDSVRIELLDPQLVSKELENCWSIHVKRKPTASVVRSVERVKTVLRSKGGKGWGLALEEACTLPGGQARKGGGHEKPCNLQPA